MLFSLASSTVSVPPSGEIDGAVADQIADEACLSGGCTILYVAGLEQLPTNVGQADFLSLPDKYENCRNFAVNLQNDECLSRFASIPQRLYQAEILVFARYCFLPDSDLSGNMQASNILPTAMSNATADVTYARMFFKLAGITQLSVSCQIQVFAGTQSASFALESTGHTFWNSKRREIKTVHSSGTAEYPDPVFGLIFPLFRAFLCLIVSLWAVGSVSEFSAHIQWWIVLCSMPVMDGNYVSVCPDTDEYEIVGLPCQQKALAILLNLLPRCLADWDLYAWAPVPDLILSSLALTFLAMVDDVLFSALGTYQETMWISRCARVKGKVWTCLEKGRT